MPSDPIDRLTLARLLRPHGIRGEIAAEILTDFPERLTKLREVWLWDARAEVLREISVEKCWLSFTRGGQAVFKFAGVDRIEDVEKLRGLEVQVPLSERMELPSGSYYISELSWMRSLGSWRCERRDRERQRRRRSVRDEIGSCDWSAGEWDSGFGSGNAGWRSADSAGDGNLSSD